MIKFNHTINLVALIDEHKVSDSTLTTLLNMDEKTLNSVLAETFINAINGTGAMETINENNTFAKIEWGNN
jgi:hypothetical protein